MSWRSATAVELPDLWRIGQTKIVSESAQKTVCLVETVPVPPHNSSRLTRHLILTTTGNPWPILTEEGGYLLVNRAGVFTAKKNADGQVSIGTEIMRLSVREARIPPKP